MVRAATATAALACAAAIAGCSTGTRPQANPPGVTPPPGATFGRGRIDDQRSIHVDCMKAAGIPVTKVGLTGLQIGAPPGGPTITFEPTAGSAQQAQISGSAQGAEVIGNALLYPNAGSDAELTGIENCLQIGVVG